MLYNHSLIIATFAIATVLISPIILGSLPGTEVYAAAILSITCQTKIVTHKNEKK